MRGEHDVARRTVLGTIAAGAAAAALPAGVSAESADRLPCEAWSEPLPGWVAGILTNHPDRYPAAVDRIVDGAHVVLLLEDGDRVVDQVVVDRDRLRRVEESDRVVVTMDDGEPVSICLVED